MTQAKAKSAPATEDAITLLTEERFPKAKKAKLDLTALGAKMLERKKELLERGGNSVAQRNARAA